MGSLGLKRVLLDRSSRKEIVRICRAMHQQGLIPGGDGNVSLQLSPDRILITPTNSHKGYLRASDLVVINSQGELVRGKRRASSEKFLHLAAYEVRSDISAVLHAHSPTVVALSIMGINPALPLMPESVVALGKVAMAPYARPGGRELADSVRPFLKESDLVILERHGCLILGHTLMDCFNALERLEHAAKVVALCHQLGSPKPLTEDQIHELLSPSPSPLFSSK